MLNLDIVILSICTSNNIQESKFQIVRFVYRLKHFCASSG